MLPEYRADASHGDEGVSRTILYRGESVGVFELTRTGPVECDAGAGRSAQAVERATMLITRAGSATLTRTGRHAYRVVTDPTRVAFLHPGDAYRVHYPAGTYRATVVTFARWGEPAPSPHSAHRDLAERACALLVAAPGDAHSLHDVARTLGVSPFYLARIFRAQVGVSLHQYLLRLRLGLALEHLAGGERNLSALGVSLGFATHSHFSAAFRQAYGASPGAVRATLTAAR